MLGNVLCLDPEQFEAWMKERPLPIHPALSSELIIPKARIDEIKAETEAVNRELTNIFTEVSKWSSAPVNGLFPACFLWIIVNQEVIIVPVHILCFYCTVIITIVETLDQLLFIIGWNYEQGNMQVHTMTVNSNNYMYK